MAHFTVPWTPGELVAVARDASGRETGRSIQRSTSGPLRLLVDADRTALTADGQDAATITIQIADATGTVELAADTKVQVEVSGPGTLAGLGSADYAPTLPYTGSVTRTWYGRALGVVRTSTEPGMITVTVRADGYPDATATLTATDPPWSTEEKSHRQCTSPDCAPNTWPNP